MTSPCSQNTIEAKEPTGGKRHWHSWAVEKRGPERVWEIRPDVRYHWLPRPTACNWAAQKRESWRKWKTSKGLHNHLVWWFWICGCLMRLFVLLTGSRPWRQRVWWGHGQAGGWPAEEDGTDWGQDMCKVCFENQSFAVNATWNSSFHNVCKEFRNGFQRGRCSKVNVTFVCAGHQYKNKNKGDLLA